MSSLALSRR
ncbi:delta-aminolevulinic acid dehydratase, partial [Chlamydia psittaci 84-8471/1]